MKHNLRRRLFLFEMKMKARIPSCILWCMVLVVLYEVVLVFLLLLFSFFFIPLFLLFFFLFFLVYLISLLLELYNLERNCEWWSGIGMEGNVHGLLEGTILGSAWKNWGKAQKTLLKMADLWAKYQTWNFWNRKQRC